MVPGAANDAADPELAELAGIGRDEGNVVGGMDIEDADRDDPPPARSMTLTMTMMLLTKLADSEMPRTIRIIDRRIPRPQGWR
jgi:hypothetical protein